MWCADFSSQSFVFCSNDAKVKVWCSLILLLLLFCVFGTFTFFFSLDMRWSKSGREGGGEKICNAGIVLSGKHQCARWGRTQRKHDLHLVYRPATQANPAPASPSHTNSSSVTLAAIGLPLKPFCRGEPEICTNQRMFLNKVQRADLPPGVRWERVLSGELRRP